MNEEIQEHPEDALPPIIAAASRPRQLSGFEVRGITGGQSDCQRSVYILLAVFLGWLGIHNFYARRFLWGGMELGVTLLLGWLMAPLLFVFVCALVEICCVKTDGDGKWMR